MGVTMAKEKKVKIYKGTAYGVLKSEIKENKTRKDYNALTGPIKVTVGVRGVFSYR